MYNKVRSEEVAPEMRTATACASARLEMEEFLEDTQVDPTLVDKSEFGLLREHYARRRFHRFTRLMGMMSAGVASPLCASCLCLGRRRRS